MCACMLNHFRLFVTLRTVARQSPLPMGFSMHEYGVGCHALLQGFFLIQGSNSCLPAYPNQPIENKFKF